MPTKRAHLSNFRLDVHIVVKTSPKIGIWPLNMANYRVSQKKIAHFFGPTSNCNNSRTVCPNRLKFSVLIVPNVDHYGLEFQAIRNNGSQVIAVGSWAEKIGNFCLLYLQFPVRLTQTSNCNNSGTVVPNRLKL